MLVHLLIDKELNHPDEKVRKETGEMVALLTPIIKAFLTDNAFTATNEGMQVFGGHGYIAEWGMEQYVRDARINMIYEGTNTIQSLDLLGRKVLGDMGKKLTKFGKIIEKFIEDEGVRKEMQEFIDPLSDIAVKVEKLTKEIGMKAMMNHEEVGAAAVRFELDADLGVDPVVDGSSDMPLGQLTQKVREALTQSGELSVQSVAPAPIPASPSSASP